MLLRFPPHTTPSVNHESSPTVSSSTPPTAYGKCLAFNPKNFDAPEISLDKLVAQFDSKYLFNEPNDPEMRYVFHAYNSKAAGQELGNLEKEVDITNFLEGREYDFIAVYKWRDGAIAGEPALRIEIFHGATYYTFDSQELANSDDVTDSGKHLLHCIPGTGLIAVKMIWKEMQLRVWNRQRKIEETNSKTPIA